jgi:fibronectin type 3 domain-containing protein/TolB-like protein
MKQSLRGLVAALIGVALILSPAIAGAVGKNALALFSLRPTNIDAMEYAGDILYTLISALEKNNTVEIMARRDMEAMLSQSGLAQSDSPEGVLKAGQALGIKYILYGQVTKTGSAIDAKLHLMNVTRGKDIADWNVHFNSREAIVDKIPAIARKLIDAVTLDGIQTQQQNSEAEKSAAAQSTLAIGNLQAQGQGKDVLISWTADPNAAVIGYQVYRSPREEGPYQFLGTTETPRYVDANVLPGSLYYYRIGILDANGNEIKNDLTASVRFTGEFLPHPPLIMKSQGDVRRVVLTFVPSMQNDQDDITVVAYRLYRKAPGEKTFAPVGRVSATKTAADLGVTMEDTNKLMDGASYTYAITSIDDKNRESGLSDPVTLHTVVCPTLKLEKDNLLRKIILDWTPVDNVDGYRIYRRIENGTWEAIDRVKGATANRFVDEDNLDDGTVYEYQVTVYDAKGESGPSNPVMGKTKDLPPYPKKFAATGGFVKSVKLSWIPETDPDVGGYNLYRGTTPDTLKRIARLKGREQNVYLDTGSTFHRLEDGTRYYYAIESFNLYKAAGALSPVADSATKPRPAAVTGLTASAQTDHIEVRWQKNTEKDIATYIVYRSVNNGDWDKQSTVEGNRTTYSDTDLKPETQYRYRIVAEDRDDLLSDPSDSAPVQSPIAPSK